MTQQFELDEDRLPELAGYPVENDHDALLLLEAALDLSGDRDGPAVTGPCELAIDLLADGDGEIDGWRIIIHPDEEYPDAPWLASSIRRVSYLELLPEPTEDGGLYDPAVIIRDAVDTANGMLAWYSRLAVFGRVIEDETEQVALSPEVLGQLRQPGGLFGPPAGPDDPPVSNSIMPAWNVLVRVTARQAAPSALEAVAAVASAVIHKGFDLYDLPSARTAYAEPPGGGWLVTVPVVAVLAAPTGPRALGRLRVALAEAGFTLATPQPQDAFRSEDGAVVTDFLPGELRS
jgi:hypothetical protein